MTRVAPKLSALDSFCCGRSAFASLALSLPFHCAAISSSANGCAFPSGTAVAVLLGVVHGEKQIEQRVAWDRDGSSTDIDETRHRADDSPRLQQYGQHQVTQSPPNEVSNSEDGQMAWKGRPKAVVLAFIVSCITSLMTYFAPILSCIPIFGMYAAREWLWNLAASFAYVGYGMIMSPATVANILIGTVLGWGILSPLAKKRGWAPGPVSDWDTGSQGWIIWVSLAAMIGDAFITVIWFATRASRSWFPGKGRSSSERRENPYSYQTIANTALPASSSLGSHDAPSRGEAAPLLPQQGHEGAGSRPASAKSRRWNWLVLLWLLFSILFCSFSLLLLFGRRVPLYATLLAIVMTLPLSIVTTYGLGETDYSIAAQISKVSQFLFSLIIPSSNSAAILVNLAMGGITEAGTWQTSDLMSDFKTAHLVGQDPRELFYAQLIGSVSGAFASSILYKMFTSVYTIPNDVFKIPSAQLWILTARLVYGGGLPEGVWPFCLGALLVSAVCAIIRIVVAGRRWKTLIPSGVAVGIGLLIVPRFTLPQGVGGLVVLISRRWFGASELLLILIASGFILGGGVSSVIVLLFDLLHVPHL